MLEDKVLFLSYCYNFLTGVDQRKVASLMKMSAIYLSSYKFHFRNPLKHEVIKLRSFVREPIHIEFRQRKGVKGSVSVKISR